MSVKALNAKPWTQFMTVMSFQQSHEKSTLGWQKENRSKGIITIKNHSITNDIHMRRHLKLCVTSEGNFRCNSQPGMVSSEVHHTLLKHVEKCFLCLYQKLVIITYPRQQELLNKRSEPFCKCRHENKYLLIKIFGANDKG